jgi:hypothetical protein
VHGSTFRNIYSGGYIEDSLHFDKSKSRTLR